MKKLRLLSPSIFCYGAPILLGLLLYGHTLQVPFNLDDYASIVGNQAIESHLHLKSIFEFWPPRFLTNLSFAINHQLHAQELPGYHLINIAIHLGTGLLVGWFTRLTLHALSLQRQVVAKKPLLTACLVSLLFIAHPLQTQAVTYIVQRASCMTAFFYILSLCCYAKSRLVSDRNQSLIFYSACIGSIVLAMFCKENSSTLPVMIILYEIFFLKRDGKMPWKRLYLPVACLLIIPTTLLLTNTLKIPLGQIPEELTPQRYLLTQFRVIVTYLRLLFIPLGQNLDYDYPIYTHLFEPAVFLSLALLSLILFLAFRLFSHHRLISFSIFWFFITLLPESSVMPIPDVIFEHRLYLPLLGYSLFIVCSLGTLLKNKSLKVWTVSTLLLIGLYSTLTYRRNDLWRDRLALWNDVVKKSPNKARVYNNRGNCYVDRKMMDRAFDDFNKALAISPDHPVAYFNRGKRYEERGLYDKALADYTRSIQLQSDRAESYCARGTLYTTHNEHQKAIADFNKAIRLKPRLSDAYKGRGAAYQALGRLDEALSDFNTAIQLGPEDAEVYSNRGVVYKIMGLHDKALVEINEAIRIKSDLPGVYNNRGNVYRAMGDLDRAIADFDKAIQIKPDYLRAINNRKSARETRAKSINDSLKPTVLSEPQ